MTSWGQRWATFSGLHTRAVLLTALLLAGVAAAGTGLLYADLRPDISELLPQDARSVHDMRIVAKQVGSWAVDTVIVHGAEPAVMKRFADDLAVKLKQVPPDTIKRVEYKVDEAADFMMQHRWLLPSLTELQRLRDRVQARLKWEKQRANPMFVSLDDDDPAPNFDEFRARLSQAKTANRFPDGYYLGDVDGVTPGSKQTILVLLVRLAGPSEDFALVQRVNQAIRQAVAELKPASYSATLDVAYGGDVASAILEHDALTEDLTLATALVIFAVALVMTFYYRTPKAILAIGLPLAVGTFSTFGIAYLVVGHLNSNTAFLGSIVLGNGINVGLILFARFLEERRRGTPSQEAMGRAIETTWLATLTAAMAAGLSYASLMATQFRGFNQFGFMGFTGMTLCWISAYAVMPALCLAWERRAPLVRETRVVQRQWIMSAIGNVVQRAPKAVLALTAVSVIAAAFGTALFLRHPIEADFTKLRDSRAGLPNNPGWWDERVDALFGDHLTPSAFLCKDDDEAQAVTKILNDTRERDPNSAIGTVVSMESFVPEQQDAKLAVLAELRTLLTPDIISRLPEADRAQVAEAVPPADLRAYTVADLPSSMRERMSNMDTMVLVYPRANVNVWNAVDVERFAHGLRAVPMPRPDIPVAGSILVFADMLDAISADGPLATLLSFVAVVVLILVAFGSVKHGRSQWRDGVLVLAVLFLGVLWFLGLAEVFRLKLNMLNFIALPITFGIGADYATNLVQRCRLDPHLGVIECLKSTGGAVALCSATTIIGYGSLLVARNQALVSFGLLAVLGEVACLGATLLPLTAYLLLRPVRT